MYVKPGVYIQEKQVGGGVGVGGFLLPCVVGVGLKQKRAWDELVERGRFQQVVTPNATGIFILTFNSDQRKGNSKLFKNGHQLPDDAYSFINATQIQIALSYRDVAAVWEFSYLAVNRLVDNLDNIPSDVVYVSKSPGGARSYRLGIDYQVTAGNIDWSLLKSAVANGIRNGPYNLTLPNNRIRLSVDGMTPIEIVITGVNQAAVTAAEVVEDINAAAAAAWGVSYNSIASVVDTNKVRITSVVVGESGRINFYVPSSGDVTMLIFGFNAPTYFVGMGVRPAVGSNYYVKYDFPRPAVDYDKVNIFYQYSDALNHLGPMNRDNELLIGVELAFLNGAQVVAATQVRDLDGDGIYMLTDWTRALNAVKASNEVTDLILLNTDTSVMAFAVDIIDDEASLHRNHWMAGWFGVPVNMPTGDVDTQNTIVHTATKTLQVGANSPGRGRYILVAPAGVRCQIVETDTRRNVEVVLDSSFLAAAIAGLQVSLPVISDSLLRKTIVGFIPTSVTMTEEEAGYLASNGVFTVVNVGGRLVCFDPVTTDSGGDELFSEVNIRPQKDYLATKIRQRLDRYAVGIVPDDLDDFIYELRSQVAMELVAAVSDKIIAPYRDRDDRVRDMDILSDIKVYQSQARKTEYRVSYWFQARWTVKRIFGEYLVDTALM